MLKAILFFSLTFAIFASANTQRNPNDVKFTSSTPSTSQTTGAVVVNGGVGIGGQCTMAGPITIGQANLDSTAGLSIYNSNLTSANQTGIYILPTFSTSATGGMVGISAGGASQAGSYTTPYWLSVFAQDISKGSGNTIKGYWFLRH